MTRELYDQLWDDPKRLRPFLERLMADLPELFPAGIEQGFTWTGRLRASVKLGVRWRQLRLRDKQVFTLRPSFVFGDMTGTVDKLPSDDCKVQIERTPDRSSICALQFRNWRSSSLFRESRLVPANSEKPNTRPQAFRRTCLSDADTPQSAHFPGGRCRRLWLRSSAAPW